MNLLLRRDIVSQLLSCIPFGLKTKIRNVGLAVFGMGAAVHFLCISTVFTILSVQNQQRNLRVLLGMMTGLYLIWIILGGLLQLFGRSSLNKWAAKSSVHWRLRFFLLCLVMGSLEEAVTTAMTNAAPFFGVHLGEVYITASSNYLDVVLGHSLVVIAPAFLAWVWLLSRYRFAPSHVLVLFGITGTLMEMISGGMAQLLQMGMWVFVYGLMVYLPACTVPANRTARSPRRWDYAVAVLAPFFFLPLCLPFILAIRTVRPSSATQFAPIILTEPRTAASGFHADDRRR